LLVCKVWFNLKHQTDWCRSNAGARGTPELVCPDPGFAIPHSHIDLKQRSNMSTHRRISVIDDGSGVSVVRFVDKKIVDSGSIEQLGEELNSLVTVEKRNMILLNFDGVEFMSSAALNKLISLNSKVKAAAGRLKICGLRAEIKEVFTITRLDRVFDLRKTEADAVAAFKL
jgi:anti-sigma B factor antagonist